MKDADQDEEKGSVDKKACWMGLLKVRQSGPKPLVGPGKESVCVWRGNCFRNSLYPSALKGGDWARIRAFWLSQRKGEIKNGRRHEKA